tara:strand:+ start:71638 stop:72177 length:540 start_codon:yes stop_codon:yes gene_type:complete
MSKDDLRLRQTGIYVSLCRNFKAQAELRSPDFDTTKLLAKKFPWVSNHPWSENGIPDDFEGLEFSVLRELREEFAIIAKTYDPEEARLYEDAAVDMQRLLQAQRDIDFGYVVDHGTPEEIEKVMQAGERLMQGHFNNEDSPYYGTYAPVQGFGLNLILGRHLKEQENKGRDKNGFNNTP